MTLPRGVERRTWSVSGRAASGLVAGAAGPLVVLVHGAGLCAEALAPLLAELGARGLRGVAPDLPGREGSEGPALTDVPAMARWVATFADGLRGDHGWVALGHSLGGAVVLEASLEGAPGLQGLVLVATGARLRVHPAVLDVVTAAAEGGPRFHAPREVFEPGVAEPLVEWVWALEERIPVATAQADWFAADAFDRLHRLAGARLPALVVGGTLDRLTPPKYARHLADGLGATLHEEQGAGHLLPLERPAALAECIRRAVPLRHGKLTETP